MTLRYARLGTLFLALLWSAGAAALSPPCSTTGGPLDPDPSYTDPTCKVTADVAHAGGYGVLYYRVFLGSGGTDLDKPIVALDAFDPSSGVGGSRLIGDLYNTYNEVGTVDELRQDGYDVVIVDYSYGADYIQRNAMALVKLLGIINGSKTSSEDLIIIGPSMGGVVSRYALSYMEGEGIDHETKMWASFDSPHRGANIPLGAQYLGLDGNGLDPFPAYSATYDFYTSITSPAARQLLVTHGEYSTASNPRPHPDHYAFYSELRGLNGGAGYPCDVRKVAIVNGSIGVLNNTFGERQGVPQRAGHGGYSVGGAVAIEYSTPTNTGTIQTYPDERLFNDTRFVYYRRVLYNYETYYRNADPGEDYDASPGGYRETFQEIHDAVQAQGDGYSATVPIPRHPFIPTFSALDFEVPSYLYPIGDEPNLLAKLPFDAFYAPTGDNEEHVELNASNEAWLLDQIRNHASEAPTCKTAVTTPPEAPTNVRITNFQQDGTHPVIAWDAVPSATSYEVYREIPAMGTGRVKIATRTGTSHTDYGVTQTSSIQQGEEVLYYVKAVNGFGASPFSSPAYGSIEDPYAARMTDGPGPTPQAALAALPERLEVGLLHPNPVRGEARLEVALPDPVRVRIHVYDLVGRLALTVADEERAAGYHSLSVDTQSLPSGTYIYRVAAGGDVSTGRFTVIR